MNFIKFTYIPKNSSEEILNVRLLLPTPCIFEHCWIWHAPISSILYLMPFVQHTSEIRRHIPQPRQFTSTSGAPHLCHLCKRVRTARHAPDSFYNPVVDHTCRAHFLFTVTGSSTEHSILTTLLPQSCSRTSWWFQNHLCHSSSQKLCLCKTSLRHFFRDLPPWCGYQNGSAFRVFFSVAEVAWHQRWDQAKWT